MVGPEIGQASGRGRADEGVRRRRATDGFCPHKSFAASSRFAVSRALSVIAAGAQDMRFNELVVRRSYGLSRACGRGPNWRRLDVDILSAYSYIRQG